MKALEGCGTTIWFLALLFIGQNFNQRNLCICCKLKWALRTILDYRAPVFEVSLCQWVRERSRRRLQPESMAREYFLNFTSTLGLV